MTLVIALIAVSAIASAAVVAIADAALFEERAEPPSSRSSAGDAGSIRNGWERMAGVLALARLFSYLIAGAAGWYIVEDASAEQGILIWGLLALTVVFVIEAASRAYGERAGSAALVRLAPLLRALNFLLAPLRIPLFHLDKVLQRLLPVPPPNAEDREAIAERFRRMVAAEAEVSRNEVAILYGVFSLRDTSVHEIMIPRVDILGIEHDAPWKEVVDRVRASAHSRLPVYEESIDEVRGILYAKDLLPFVLNDQPPDGGWPSLVRPAVFIPRTRLIGEQLRDFRMSRSHMAIVVDEYGGTAGLVTIEDVLEEIVGDIRDEYDEEEPEVEVRDGSRFWLSGRVTLEEASELLGVELEREGISTVGGLVYEELGRVPRPGEVLKLDGFRVIVEQVQRRKVRRVYFERVDDATADVEVAS